MSLIRHQVAIDRASVPSDAIPFLESLRQHSDRFLAARAEHPIPEFVASDPWIAYGALKAIQDGGCVTGRRFCEWGSGLGTVSCVARHLGFEVTGIEISLDLIGASIVIADEHSLDVKFVHGSFKPQGIYTDEVDRASLDRDLGFSPVDFDVVYAYPWPAEERAIFRLFSNFAPVGAVLVTFHGGLDLRVHRVSE